MKTTVVKRVRKRMIDLNIPSDAALARRLGVSGRYVSYTLRGERRGERVRKGLAKVLDLPERLLLSA